MVKNYACLWRSHKPFVVYIIYNLSLFFQSISGLVRRVWAYINSSELKRFFTGSSLNFLAAVGASIRLARCKKLP